MKQWLIFLMIVITGLFQFGCSTPEYFSLPAQRFESPQVRGQWGGGFELGFADPIYVVVIQDSSAVPPSSSGSAISREVDGGASEFLLGLDRMNMGLRIGVLDQLELAVKTGSPFAPSSTQAKFQFLGQSRKASKGPGWNGSLYGSYLYTNIEKSVNNFKISSIQVVGYEAGVVIGYQTKSIAMPYLNLTYVDVTSNTTINQTTPATYEYKGQKASQKIVGIGARAEGDWGGNFSLEASLSETAFENATSKWFGSGGMKFGIDW